MSPRRRAGQGTSPATAVVGGGASTLDDLTDVSTTGQAAGRALVSNGTSWAPSTAAAVLGDDSRLTDARTPTSHSHAASEVTSGTLDIARIPTGQTGTTVPLGNDARFTDSRTPTAHTHPASAISDSTSAGRALVTGADAAAQRTSLGLGGAAVLAVGTTAGTVAAGDDSRVTGAAQKSSNLSDLANAGTARTNLGLAAVAASGSASDLGSGTVATARLGSGTANADKSLAGDQTWKDGVFGDASIKAVVKLTQAAYDALGGSVVATTLYVIVG